MINEEDFYLWQKSDRQFDDKEFEKICHKALGVSLICNRGLFAYKSFTQYDDIGNISEKNQELFFYSNLNHIHLTNPIDFNDIKECNIYADVTTDVFAEMFVVESLYINKAISRKKYCKAQEEIKHNKISLVYNNILLEDLPLKEKGIIDLEKKGKKLYNEILNRFKKTNFRVACFTTANPELDDMMWAYYGESHKGYCLQYSTDILLSKVHEKHSCIRAFEQNELTNCLQYISDLYPVHYTEKKVLFPLSTFIKEIVSDYDSFIASETFLSLLKNKQFEALKQKRRCWKSEKEIRLIVDTDVFNCNLEKVGNEKTEYFYKLVCNKPEKLFLGNKAKDELKGLAEKANNTFFKKENTIDVLIDSSETILPF